MGGMGLMLAALVLSSGCARLTQMTTTTSAGTNGVIETRISKSTGWALFGSKQSFENMRVTNGKTQAIGISGLEQDAQGTNVTALLEGAIGAAVREAVKAAKP